MQIGSGSNSLPGRRSGATDTPPPLPADSPASRLPDLAEPSRSGRRWRRAGIVAALLAAVAVSGLAGERVTRGMAWRRTMVPSVAAGVKRVAMKVADVLHVFRAAVTNDDVSLSPTQLRIAAEYSPIGPISEAKRAESLERDRVVAGGTVIEARVQAAVAPAAELAADTGRNVHATAEKAVVWPPVRITAIIGDRRSNGYIRINGRLLTTGDSIDGVVVTAISNRSVTLTCGGRSRVFYVGDGR